MEAHLVHYGSPWRIMESLFNRGAQDPLAGLSNVAAAAEAIENADNPARSQGADPNLPATVGIDDSDKAREDDDESEWEYEYSTTETEVPFTMLDPQSVMATDPPRPTT